MKRMISLNPWRRFFSRRTPDLGLQELGGGRRKSSADNLAPHLPSATAPISPDIPPAALFTTAAMQRAWRAIHAAGGGAGVDGVTLDAFAENLDDELERLRQSLISGDYRPQPPRQVLVPKAKGGLRPLAIWSLRDRVAQRAVYDITAPSFEVIFLPCSFGYRTGLGARDAASQITIHRDQGLRWVVDADIDSCFDSINTRRLMRLVKRRVRHRHLLRLIRAWLQARILNTASGKPAAAGLAQGGVLSPLLANVYLHEFDLAMARQQMALVRYADDFVICCRRKTEAQRALQASEKALVQLDLRLNQYKTRLVHFDQGFKFVGFFFVRNQVYRL